MKAVSIRVLERAMLLLQRIADDRGGSSLTALAEDIGIAPTTAHRLAAVLKQRRWIAPAGRGRYVLGMGFIEMLHQETKNEAMQAVGEPILKRLALETGLVAQLGVFDDSMVTYLVKRGRRADSIVSREGRQLEAYCSGVGKALLAFMPREQQDRYLREGPFVALTPNTITDASAMRAELMRVQSQGYALDNRELDSSTLCLAAPILTAGSVSVAAVSLSTVNPSGEAGDLLAHLPALSAAAAAVQKALFE